MGESEWSPALLAHFLLAAREAGRIKMLISYLLSLNNKPMFSAYQEWDSAGYVPLHWLLASSKSVLFLFYFPLDTISRWPCLSAPKPLEPLKVWIQPQHILEDRGQVHTSHPLFFHKYQLQFPLGSFHVLRDSSNQMIPMLTNLEAITPQFPSLPRTLQQSVQL